MRILTWKQIACCAHSPAVLIILKFQNTDYGELLSIFISVGEGYRQEKKTKKHNIIVAILVFTLI